MFILKRKLLGLLALSAGAVLGWGYWHVSTHGTLYASVNDVALKNDRQVYGRVLNANLTFLDAAGNVLAQARAAEPLGVVTVLHPEAGDCSRYERQASFDSAAREAWQRCFKTVSHWLMKWVRNVRYTTVILKDCRIDELPASLREYRDDWWLWWVPLPHLGGAPYTNFELTVTLDSAHCRAAK
jgi:hypothetical protein